MSKIPGVLSSGEVTAGEPPAAALASMAGASSPRPTRAANREESSRGTRAKTTPPGRLIRSREASQSRTAGSIWSAPWISRPSSSALSPGGIGATRWPRRTGGSSGAGRSLGRRTVPATRASTAASSGSVAKPSAIGRSLFHAIRSRSPAGSSCPSARRSSAPRPCSYTSPPKASRPMKMPGRCHVDWNPDASSGRRSAWSNWAGPATARQQSTAAARVTRATATRSSRDSRYSVPISSRSGLGRIRRPGESRLSARSMMAGPYNSPKRRTTAHASTDAQKALTWVE